MEKAEQAHQRGRPGAESSTGRSSPNAREEANRIIEEARKTADQLRMDLQGRAEQESQDIVARAQEEIRAERDRVFQELRTQVGQIAVELAGKVVGQSLDQTAHERLIDEYIDQVASGNGTELTWRTTHLIDGYAQALFAVAQAEGALDKVEDELYAFGRPLEQHTDLREALTDAAPARRRTRRRSSASCSATGRTR